MKTSIAAIAAFCALAGTAHAADSDSAPHVFKPAGQWVADYGDDYCRLSRSFSDGTDTFSLALERIHPGTDMRIILVGPELKTFRSATTIGWHFLPNDPERKALVTYSRTADGKVWTNLGETTIAPFAPPAPGTPPPPYDRGAERASAEGVTGFALDNGLIEPVELDTGNLGAAIGALQACADDLVKSWGVDPDKQKEAQRRAFPDGNTSKWLPTGTIAFGDFAKLGGGMNQVRLMVDATGKPTDCKIHFPTLEQSTNDKVCKALLENARFKPALDADGKPFASYYVTSPLFLLGPPPGGRH